MTPKRERFVEEYLIDTNGAKAAIRAGYSPKTAKEQAMKLMKVPEVQQAIAKRLEALSSAKIADVQEIMESMKPLLMMQPQMLGIPPQSAQWRTLGSWLAVATGALSLKAG